MIKTEENGWLVSMHNTFSSACAKENEIPKLHIKNLMKERAILSKKMEKIKGHILSLKKLIEKARAKVLFHEMVEEGKSDDEEGRTPQSVRSGLGTDDNGEENTRKEARTKAIGGEDEGEKENERARSRSSSPTSRIESSGPMSPWSRMILRIFLSTRKFCPILVLGL